MVQEMKLLRVRTTEMRGRKRNVECLKSYVVRFRVVEKTREEEREVGAHNLDVVHPEAISDQYICLVSHHCRARNADPYLLILSRGAPQLAGRDQGFCSSARQKAGRYSGSRQEARDQWRTC